MTYQHPQPDLWSSDQRISEQRSPTTSG